MERSEAICISLDSDRAGKQRDIADRLELAYPDHKLVGNIIG